MQTELRPLSVKGRAWIAADSGPVIHLETNLLGPILSIDLREIAISADYAQAESHSLNAEVWLPQFAVAYTDYAQRRMIIERDFSDFELFSVQTRETIGKPSGNQGSRDQMLKGSFMSDEGLNCDARLRA